MLTRHSQTVMIAGSLLAAFALVIAPDTCSAQKKNVQTVSNTQLTQALQVLHDTKVLLQNADHDYGGHRAAAVRDIGAAHHQLRLAMGLKPAGKNPNAIKKGPANPMPETQEMSDMQLANAIPVLKQAVVVMNSVSNDFNGHRAEAVLKLNAAVDQLGKALAFRQGKAAEKN